MNPEAVECYYHETDERQHERRVGSGEVAKDRSQIDNLRLHPGKYRTAEDGHDKTSCTELGIVAKAVEGNAIDRWEHERHATTHAYQAVYAQSILEEDNAEGEHHSQHGKDGEQLGWLQPLHDAL